MESSITDVCKSKNRSIHLKHLRHEQEKTKEGSKDWSYYQNLINQIIAKNYLHYVNR